MCGSQVWVVASTHPQKEPIAITNLERQGFESYCPMIRKRTRHARRVRDVLRPLFPGYVFIRLDPAYKAWRPVLSTIGIRKVIQFGDQMGVLPVGLVEKLKAREENGAISLAGAGERYRPGELVRLVGGPLEGLVATVLAACENERLLLLLQILGRGVRVQTSTGIVARA